MLETRLGETAALLTAVCWSFTSINFEEAAKKVGALSVNFWRLVLAFIFLGLYLTVTAGFFIPIKAGTHLWLWLSLSGLVGFVLGDYCLFQAYVEVGARIAMLIMALVPPITTIIGWLLLGETLTWLQFCAMLVTVGGIAYVVFERNANQNGLRLAKPLRGVLLALGGAFGQAVGLVLSKYGMGSSDAFAATQIRVITGVLGFGGIIIITGKFEVLADAVKDSTAIKRIGIGAFFGPFLGVSLSLYAVQHTVAGVASSIMAIVPVLIIPFAVAFLKEKVKLKEIFGAVITVVGVILFFL